MNVVRSSSSQEYKTRIRTFFVLYFLQGLPHGLQSGFLPLFFRAHGMSLANVSLYKLLLIPWVLKAVWAPIVDSYGHKKLWLTWSLIALIFISVTASNVSPSDYTSLTGILFIFNLIISVQDIAVDAFLIDVLTPSQLATGNTAQVVGYKAGSLFAGGVFAWFIDLISLRVIFITLAILYTLGLLVSITYLPYTDSAEVHQISPNAQQRTSTNNLVTGTVQHNATIQSQSLSHGDGRWFFLKLLETDGTLWMLAFMLLYKTGENGVTNLLPLFLLDEGVHAHDVGFWTGMVGQGMSMLGSAVGGFIFTSSMTTSLQIQLTSRTVSVLFIWLSVLLWSSSFPFVNGSCIFFLMVLFFFGGAVTTCTFTLVMQLSQKAPQKYRASYYTMLTTTEVIGKLFFSAAVGTLAQYTSYSFAFGLFSFLSIMILPMIFQAPQAVLSL